MHPIYKKYLVMVALVWGGSLVLLLAGYLLLLAPQKGTLISLEAQLAEKEREYKNAEIAASNKAKEQLGARTKHLTKKLGDYVADFNDLGDLSFSISRIAGQMRVGAFESRGRGGGSYTDIPNCDYIGRSDAIISFTASFNRFASVVNALERHRPVFFVDEFSITKARKSELEHQVNMLLTVFVRKPQDSQGEAGPLTVSGRSASNSSSAHSTGDLR